MTLLDNIELKKCTKCGDLKPKNREYFHKNKIRKDGFSHWCKICTKEYKREHYQRNRQNIDSKNKQYYMENIEEIAKYKNEHYQRNKDIALLRSRLYYKNNKTKVLKYRKVYYKENKQLCRRYSQIRLAKLKELPYTLTLSEWKYIKSYFNNECAYCGMSEKEHLIKYEEVLHQEHIKPLSRGGGYTKENIIPACRKCNTSKYNHNFQEWYKQCQYYTDERYDKVINYIENKGEVG